MDFDAKRFIQEEGLSIDRFDQWLEKTEDLEKKDPLRGKKITTKNATLLSKMLTGIRSENEVECIVRDVLEGNATITSGNGLLLIVECSVGTFRVPKPMVRILD